MAIWLAPAVAQLTLCLAEEHKHHTLTARSQDARGDQVAVGGVCSRAGAPRVSDATASGVRVPRGWRSAGYECVLQEGGSRAYPAPPAAGQPASPLRAHLPASPRPFFLPWAPRAAEEPRTADGGRVGRSRPRTPGLGGPRGGGGLCGAGSGKEDAPLDPDRGGATSATLSRWPWTSRATARTETGSREEPSAGAPPRVPPAASPRRSGASTPGGGEAHRRRAGHMGGNVRVLGAAPSLHTLWRWPGAPKTRLRLASSSHGALPPGDREADCDSGGGEGTCSFGTPPAATPRSVRREGSRIPAACHTSQESMTTAPTGQGHLPGSGSPLFGDPLCSRRGTGSWVGLLL